MKKQKQKATKKNCVYRFLRYHKVSTVALKYQQEEKIIPSVQSSRISMGKGSTGTRDYPDLILAAIVLACAVRFFLLVFLIGDPVPD